MKKIIACVVILFLICWGFKEYIDGWSHFSGSYSYAACYTFDAPEADVISAIESVKAAHRDLQPPNQDSFLYARKPTIYRMEPVMDDSSMQAYQEFVKTHPNETFDWKMQQVADPDYWLDVDFYYSDSKEIVHTWTRPEDDSTKTTFAFVSISPLNQPKTFRLINKDFWYVANKSKIEKFKTEIVDRIQEKLNRMKKGE